MAKKKKTAAEELKELVEDCAEHCIKEHCAKHNLVIPAIYYRPLPPEMANDFYVVTGKHYQRRMELKRRIDGTAKAEDTVQLSLF